MLTSLCLREWGLDPYNNPHIIPLYSPIIVLVPIFSPPHPFSTSRLSSVLRHVRKGQCTSPDFKAWPQIISFVITIMIATILNITGIILAINSLTIINAFMITTVIVIGYYQCCYVYIYISYHSMFFTFSPHLRRRPSHQACQVRDCLQGMMSKPLHSKQKRAFITRQSKKSSPLKPHVRSVSHEAAPNYLGCKQLTPNQSLS